MQLKRIHPLDVPLEVFLADLSTKPRNVIRAELAHFDRFHDEDIKPPFTVRHLVMFSRRELKKWPGLGRKGLNEVEELLRARGLQLWDAHDERSLRLLREHATYFTTPPASKPAEGGAVAAMKRRLVRVHDALCNDIGDTDPDVPDDMTDDEVCEEMPVFWAAKEIAALIGNGPLDKYTTPPASQEQAQQPNEWREMIQERFDINHSAMPSDPREAVLKLIRDEVAMALDPVCSSQAEALIQRGRDEAQQPQAQAQELPDEREAFEREMSCEEIWGHRSFKKKPDGRYANWCVDLMWDVWQARAAMAQGVKG